MMDFHSQSYPTIDVKRSAIRQDFEGLRVTRNSYNILNTWMKNNGYEFHIDYFIMSYYDYDTYHFRNKEIALHFKISNIDYGWFINET